MLNGSLDPPSDEKQAMEILLKICSTDPKSI